MKPDLLRTLGTLFELRTTGSTVDLTTSRESARALELLGTRLYPYTFFGRIYMVLSLPTRTPILRPFSVQLPTVLNEV